MFKNNREYLKLKDLIVEIKINRSTKMVEFKINC